MFRRPERGAPLSFPLLRVRRGLFVCVSELACARGLFSWSSPRKGAVLGGLRTLARRSCLLLTSHPVISIQGSAW